MKVDVIFRGINLIIEGLHYPEEPAVRYDSDMAGHPGYPEYFDIANIYIENTEVLDLLEEYLEEIEKLVLEQINEQ